MADRSKVNLEDVIGKYGPFQRVVCILATGIGIFGAYHTFVMSILAPDLDHWCARTEGYDNLTAGEWRELAIPLVTVQGVQRFSQCDVKSLDGTNDTFKCGRWDYDNRFYRRTFTEKWNLVCSNSWLVSLSQSVFSAGVMAAMATWGQLSDRIGRRPVICAAISILLISGCGTLLAQNFLTFIVLRFFVSFGLNGAGTTSFVHMLEVIGQELRSIGLITGFGWATGYLLLALVAYFSRDWFYVQLVIVAASFTLTAAFWMLPESPRWLLSNGKHDKARQVIMNAVRHNGLNRDAAMKKFEVLKAAFQTDHHCNARKKAKVTDLLKTPAIRIKTSVLFGCWFANSFAYYALSLHVSDLGGDPFVNFAIAGAVEFPAYAVSIWMITRAGRKKSQSGTMALAGIACALTIPFSDVTDQLPLKIAFAMTGKFMITASFGILYIYSAEIYPTVVRSAGVGTCIIIAQVAAMIAPFLKELGDATHRSLPFGLCSAICILSGVSVLLLPETSNVQLSDTLLQGEPCEACFLDTETAGEQDPRDKAVVNGGRMNGGIVEP